MKLQCPFGHQYSHENSLLIDDGWYVCRECQRRDGQAIVRRSPPRKSLTPGRLMQLYAILIEDAIIIQSIDKDHYDVLDIWYDISVHFSVKRLFPDMTRRYMTLGETIYHADLIRMLVKKYYPETETDAHTRATDQDGV